MSTIVISSLLIHQFKYRENFGAMRFSAGLFKILMKILRDILFFISLLTIPPLQN